MSAAKTDRDAERLKHLLSTVTDGIVVVDQLGTVLYANESAVAIFGDRPLVGRNIGVPVAPHGVHQDIQIVRNGGIGWAELRTAPIEWNGTVATVGSFRDITERREAEEALRSLNGELEERVQQRTSELREANKELESFAYSVSHDLRIPLRAINGFSQILQQKYGSQFTDEAGSYLSQISRAGQKMGELIEALLALSRSSCGELRRDVVDVSLLSETILAKSAVMDPDRQVEYRVEPGLGVDGDARLIEVVMQNLLSNAWKYSSKTPHARIAVTPYHDNGRCWICVADNGAGFDPAYAQQLFQPFKRLHRQDEFPGIGIGLATVQRIIRRHGGEIRASAEPGKGARFCFWLPVVRESPQG